MKSQKFSFKSVFVSLSVCLMIIFASSAFAALSDTGITKCYNDTAAISCPSPGKEFYGQDGNYTINPPSYTKLDAKGNSLSDTYASFAMVKDNNTGLIWENKTTDGSTHDAGKTYSWDDAQKVFIAQLNSQKFGGYSDWRLPAREELLSIADYSRYKPAINYNPTIKTGYFPNTKSDSYWSSSTSTYGTDFVWYMDFSDGSAGRIGKSHSNYVRAVRGSSSVRSFTDNGDGTVTDNRTGLMWQQATGNNGVAMAWNGALAYCGKNMPEADSAGYTDWRLPNIRELALLADVSRSSSPAIDTDYFPDTSKSLTSSYWSSSTSVNRTGNAWNVGFSYSSSSFVGTIGKSGSLSVRCVRGGGVTTTATASPVYVTQFGTSGTGNGQFSGPSGIAIDSSGNIFVADYGNSRIQKFSSSGAYISKFGTSGTGNGQLDGPYGIAIDTSGNIYVADSGNDRIQKFSKSGTYISQFGTSGSDNGQFSLSNGIEIDKSGNIWVVDTDNDRIQKFSKSGTYISKFGTTGTGNGQFTYPDGMAIDSSGNIWVADTFNDRIQKFSSSGTYISQFGSYGTGNGQFDGPEGITSDSSGNIWVVDSGNHRIQKFSSTGTYLSQFGTEGTGNGQFSYPHDIAIDSSGNIWVADTFNNRIQKFSVSKSPVFSYAPPACFGTDDALAITVSCAQYQGVQYGFILNYTPVSDDPTGYYWKMDTSAFSQVEEYSCMTVNDDLKLNLCVEYQGIQYGFTMNYAPVSGDSAGIYWKADLSTFSQIN